MEELAQAIQAQTAVAVSNGSFNPDTKRATYEAQLENKQRSSQIKITQYVPGKQEEHSAYRAELAGIAASCIATKLICRTYNIRTGKITICCDGKSALDRAIGTWDVRVSDKHHDLLQLIHEVQTDLTESVLFTPYWVKGHLDSKIP